MAGDTIPGYLWKRVLRYLRGEGYHFEKAYRVEVTPEEIKVWHDEYTDAGTPVMDKERKMPIVKRTRIT